MRYAQDQINTALLKLIETDNSIEYPSGTGISAYTEVSNDSVFPLIVIEPNSSGENDVTRDSIGQSYSMNVEVLAKYKQGAGGWGANNNITNQLTEILRDKGLYLDLSADDFKVKSQIIQSITTIREAYKDGVYFRTIISLEIKIEDLT